jgi:NTP pyrophosphatase (non-canonical NTP hydrolase)
MYELKPAHTANRLTFAQLRLANTMRLPQFKNAQGEPAHAMADGSDWSPADWMLAVVGELGEAANLMKKIKRGDFADGSQLDEARAKLKKEFADVITYMDLMAYQFRFDLGEAVTEKFNEVSARVGSSIFLFKLLNGSVIAADEREIPF